MLSYLNYRTASLIVTLLPFFIFYSVAFGDSTFISHDLLYLFLPRYELTRELLLQGQLPLWNPYSFGGTPHLSDSQSAILHPFTWLFLVLPPNLAIDLSILLNFSIAGLGILYLANSISLAPLSALIAAISFMFSGFMVGHLIHPSLMNAAALIPLIIGSIVRYLGSPGRYTFLLPVFLISIQILTGHPQVPFYTLVIITAFAFGSLFGAKKNYFVIFIGLPLIYLSAILLCAVQLLPMKSYVDDSLRMNRPSYEFQSSRSLARSDLILFLAPFYKGSLGDGPFANPNQLLDNEASIQLWETAGYTGLITLVLALIGLFRRESASTTYRISILLTLLFGFALAFGNSSGIGTLLYQLPIVSGFRDYSRGVLLISFAISIMAALTFELLFIKRARLSLISLTIIILIALDLSIFATTFHKLESRSELNQIPPSVEYLRNRNEGRKLTLVSELPRTNRLARDLIFGSQSMGFQIRDINGFSSLQSLRFTDLFYGSQTPDVSYGLTSNYRSWRFNAPLLSLLNVRYFITQKGEHTWLSDSFKSDYSDDQIVIYKNPESVEHAFIAREVISANADQSLDALRNLNSNYISKAWVEELPADYLTKLNMEPNSAKIVSSDFKNNYVQIVLESSSDSFLVLNEAYDRGWRATIDGEYTNIYRTNYLMQGIAIPPGKHTIRFYYLPENLIIGAIISIITLISIFFIAKLLK